MNLLDYLEGNMVFSLLYLAVSELAWRCLSAQQISPSRWGTEATTPLRPACMGTASRWSSTSAWMGVALTNWKARQVRFGFLFIQILANTQKQFIMLILIQRVFFSHSLKTCILGLVVLCSGIHMCMHSFIGKSLT